MQIALVATMMFALLWFVALRPKSSGGEAAPEPVPAAQVEEQAAAQPEPAPAPAPRAAPAPRTSRPAARAAAGGGIVGAALRRGQAVAIAFVDPRTADARAVREELRHVSRFGGRAMTLSVPIAQLSRYEFLTREIEVTVAPTVVIVSPKRTATTIVGFADRAEIEQGLADALSRRR